MSAFQRTLEQSVEALGADPKAVFTPLGDRDSAACLWGLSGGSFPLAAGAHIQLLIHLSGQPIELDQAPALGPMDQCLWLLPPGTPADLAARGPASLFHLMILPRALGANARRLNPAAPRGLDLAQPACLVDPFLVSLIRSLAGHNRVQFQASGPFRDSLTDLVCLTLLDGHGRAADAAADGDGLDFATLERIEGFVDSHMDHKIATEDLASLAGLSMFHFSRKFKHTTGLSPYEFVLIRRVHRARALLAETNRSIAQIALDVGFSNQSHFTTVFKQILGQTPGRYRERAHNGG